jgi:hypothetical protein
MQLAELFPDLQWNRRDLVVELLRQVAGTYTLGRSLVPILDDDLAVDMVDMLDAGMLSRELFEFARRNAESARQPPPVRTGYNVRAQFGLERAGVAPSSPFEYFTLGTAEQLQIHAASIWGEIQRNVGGGLAAASSGNRAMLLSIWERWLGQGKHDEAALVWFSPVRPSTWDYLQICGDRSTFTPSISERATTGACRLPLDAGGKLSVDIRAWRRTVPKRHCAFCPEFEITSVRRGGRSPHDWQSRHWREAGITPFGAEYDEWVCDNTSVGTLALRGSHPIHCSTYASLLVARFAPVNRGFGALGRMLYMALDWASGCITAIQLNAIDLHAFLQLTPQARVVLRHGLGL